MSFYCLCRPAGPVVLFVSFVVLTVCLATACCDDSSQCKTSTTKPDVVITQPQPAVYDTRGQTDNSACIDCHMDLLEEPIAARHLEAGIVCAACHGASEAHGSDELNITPPDVTFGRSEIESFCTSCHPEHETGEDYDAFVKEWHGKRRPNGRMILEDSVCTDCHGNHAILSPDQQSF